MKETLDERSQQQRFQKPHLTVWSMLGGLSGAVLASLCCIPGAVAVAIGSSVGVAASLFELQHYQRFFQIAGLALALGWSWWLVRRSQKACSATDHRHNKDTVPLLVMISFGVVFVVLNVLIIPKLEGG